jgi:hypothetical protein
MPLGSSDWAPTAGDCCPAEIEPVMQLAPEDRCDRDKVNKAVRRWGTSGSLRYDGAVRMPGSSTQASRANQA